ncbi:hypothetical protein TWF718_005616 [Orbilia javanica]|uniref:Uncharacterized protein n=1 Tax=Orbilia javanica TaxID=47235 RepID=A0AAN8N1T7_9PEZI
MELAAFDRAHRTCTEAVDMASQPSRLPLEELRTPRNSSEPNAGRRDTTFIKQTVGNLNGTRAGPGAAATTTTATAIAYK